MKVSVVVCTYSPKMYDHFAECINSLISQSYKDIEVVCIVDGDMDYFNLINEKMSDLIGSRVRIYVNKGNLGLTESRNRAIKFTTGDIIAFIDDDAVASPNWIEELVKKYKEGAISSGGKLKPYWISKKLKWLPEEFYWMIGVTHLGFPDEKAEVRNTFGSNISFKREVLIELGGFKSDFGIRGEGQLQAEETEFCERMRSKYKRGVIYNPNAIVFHKIFEKRTKFGFLVKRAFWQGYSKAMMENMSEIGEEKSFLKFLIINRTLNRLMNFIKGSGEDFLKLAAIWIFTFFVVTGYLYGRFSTSTSKSTYGSVNHER